MDKQDLAPPGGTEAPLEEQWRGRVTCNAVLSLIRGGHQCCRIPLVNLLNLAPRGAHQINSMVPRAEQKQPQNALRIPKEVALLVSGQQSSTVSITELVHAGLVVPAVNGGRWGVTIAAVGCGKFPRVISASRCR